VVVSTSSLQTFRDNVAHTKVETEITRPRIRSDARRGREARDERRGARDERRGGGNTTQRYAVRSRPTAPPRMRGENHPLRLVNVLAAMRGS